MIVTSLLFAVTAGFSIYGVFFYRKNGSLPEYSVQDAEHLPIEDQGFATDISDKFENHQRIQLDHPDQGETQFTHMNVEEQTHPSGPIPWNLQQPRTAPAELGYDPVDTSYYGSGHPYEPTQQPPPQPTLQRPDNNSALDTGFPNEGQSMGGLRPLPLNVGGHSSSQNLALQYDHGGYASGGRVDFPEGDYSR